MENYKILIGFLGGIRINDLPLEVAVQAHRLIKSEGIDYKDREVCKANIEANHLTLVNRHQYEKLLKKLEKFEKK